MTVQIIRKRCTVCNAYIYLSPNVISELGTKIPLDVNGQPHDRLHGYIHRKAKEIRNTREYWDVLNAISDELEVKEFI